MMSRLRLRRLTWLALSVMLGLALAPTVSRASSALHTGHESAVLAAASGHAEHAACDEADAGTPTRSAVSAPDTDAVPAQVAAHSSHSHHGGGGTAEPHDHLNHCPLCGVAATAWTVAPPAPVWGAVPHGDLQRALPARDTTPCGRDAWSDHQPRGPPAHA